MRSSSLPKPARSVGVRNTRSTSPFLATSSAHSTDGKPVFAVKTTPQGEHPASTLTMPDEVAFLYPVGVRREGARAVALPVAVSSSTMPATVPAALVATTHLPAKPASTRRWQSGLYALRSRGARRDQGRTRPRKDEPYHPWVPGRPAAPDGHAWSRRGQGQSRRRRWRSDG